MDIFTSNAGRVSVIKVTSEGPGRIIEFQDQGNGKFETLPSGGCIITGLNYDQESNVQMMHTMREGIYVYVFGNMLGDVAVSGIAFPNTCSALGGATTNGILKALDYYKANKLPTSFKSVKIAVCGSHIIVGILLGMKLQTIDPNIGSHQFSFMLKSLP